MGHGLGSKYGRFFIVLTAFFHRFSERLNVGVTDPALGGFGFFHDAILDSAQERLLARHLKHEPGDGG